MGDNRLSAVLGLLGFNGPFPGTEGTQLNTQLKEILRAKGAEHLLGSSDAELTQWLSLAQSITLLGSEVALKNMCGKVSSSLAARSFLVGQTLSAADAALFHAITSSPHYTADTVSSCVDLVRWMSHVSVVCTGQRFGPDSVAPTVFPLLAAKAKPPAAQSKSEAAATTDKVASVKSAAAVAPEKAKKGGEAAEAASDLDPSKLDIRVGLVTKCWAHPESDKLYCEEIDVGEESVRSIASGLRAFYSSAADIENRKVLVLANLKERPLAGFKSQGMVLCASNEDHTVVQLVEPPANSKPGDRVLFKGFDGEAATPAQVAKKKIFEKLAPDLRTDENGVAHWGTVPFTVGGELCRSPGVPNAHVS